MKRILIALWALSMPLTLPACAYSPYDTQQPETIFSGAPAAYAVSDDMPAFPDVPDGAWYAEAVRYCVKNGLMDGTSSDLFSPGGPTTRGVLVTALYRQAGSPAIQQRTNFTDVPAGAAYADAVSWAAANGIAGGYGDGRFGGEDPVAIDSVGADLLMNEPTVTSRNGSLRDNPTVENYLHEAGLVGHAPSGTAYTDSQGSTIANLGAHEHWNNSVDKQYSRNLGKNEGIELIYLKKCKRQNPKPVTQRKGRTRKSAGSSFSLNRYFYFVRHTAGALSGVSFSAQARSVRNSFGACSSTQSR